MTEIALIVLAAGMGTRMKSAIPKVLHRAAGRSLVGHVLAAGRELAPRRTAVVVGPDMPAVAEEARRYLPEAAIAIQEKRLGTGHAVSMAREALAGFSGTVLVLYGDAPLVLPGTLKKLVTSVTRETPLAVLGFRAANPTGYGRLLPGAPGTIRAIREELDATAEEREIKLCNSGIIAVESGQLASLLPKLGNANAKGEYYLTDVFASFWRNKWLVSAVKVIDPIEVMGINDLAQLEVARQRMAERA